MTVFDNFKDLLFPLQCPACKEKITRSAAPLCSACQSEYERQKNALCPRCRQPNKRCVCAPVNRSGDVFAYLSVFPYSGRSPGGRMILAIKDRKVCRIVHFLARDMAESLHSGCILRRDALVTFVPRARKALSESGVDQAKELGKEVSTILSLPFAATLAHTGAGGAQKSLDAAGRAKHARESYGISKKCPALDGRQIVLVDDIVTTGATLSACAALLKERGAGQVVCLTAGKTGKSVKSGKNG